MALINIEYRGYNFRSVLEASWAVFFEEIGLRWEYITEGYVLNNGYYFLPSFKVLSPQGYISWYEVKTESQSKDLEISTFRDGLDNGGLPTDNASQLNGAPHYVVGDNCFGICPRCGDIKQKNGNSDWDTFIIDNEAQYSVNYPCYRCDIDTPCGRDNDFEVDIFGNCDVLPYKGVIRLYKSRYMRFKKNVLRAARLANQARI